MRGSTSTLRPLAVFWLGKTFLTTAGTVPLRQCPCFTIQTFHHDLALQNASHKRVVSKKQTLTLFQGTGSLLFNAAESASSLGEDNDMGCGTSASIIVALFQ